MVDKGCVLLHERNPKLHASQEVELVVDYLRGNGESIPNEPSHKISVHLEFLANRQFVNDGIFTGEEQSIERQIEAHVIKSEDVPSTFFELQQRIAREQGFGDIVITDEFKSQLIDVIQTDQRESLKAWAEYLSESGSIYPNWFRYYTWNSVVKLGNFDKTRMEFRKRSHGTTAVYPELNREALGNLFDLLNQSRILDTNIDEHYENQDIQLLLASANFSKLYALLSNELSADFKENEKETKGSWVKYHQTTSSLNADDLALSLKGHNTGWCTANKSTASMQLSRGDFYVYYTTNSSGEETVPRIAIRMDGDNVAEVRGVDHSQELEVNLYDIALEKLAFLPGGDKYMQRTKDLKLLTEIDNKLQNNPAMYLDIDELAFLYEIDRRIISFGYNRDPRIESVKQKRNIFQDLQTILKDKPYDLAVQIARHGGAEMFLENLHLFDNLDHTKMVAAIVENAFVDSSFVFENLGKFKDIDVDVIASNTSTNVLASNIELFRQLDMNTAKRLIEDDFAQLVIKNLEKFAETDQGDILQLLMSKKLWVDVADNVDKFTSCDHNQLAHELIDRGLVRAVATNIRKFSDLDVSIGLRLIATRQGNIIAANIEKFANGTHNHIAHELIKKGFGVSIVEHAHRFTGLDNSIAKLFITNGYGYDFILKINSFDGPFDLEIAKMLIAQVHGDYIPMIINRFSSELHAVILANLIIEGCGQLIPMCINNFEGINHEKVALTLLQKGFGNEVIRSIDNFSGLSPRTKAKIILETTTYEPY